MGKRCGVNLAKLLLQPYIEIKSGYMADYHTPVVLIEENKFIVFLSYICDISAACC